MRRLALAALASLALVGLAGTASAQESKSAQTTRKKLQQTLTIEAKEIGTKAFLDDVNREIDQPFRYFIDNASGVSNNTKVTLKVKDATVEQVLNEMCDKLDCGWYVESNVANNKRDGMVIVRKSSKGKERGYEAGKAPKKSAAGPAPRRGEPERPAVVRALPAVPVAVVRVERR